MDRTAKAMQRVRLTEAQVRECAAILEEAFERIRQTLKDPGDRPPAATDTTTATTDPAADKEQP
jgi:hypothetical protein